MSEDVKPLFRQHDAFEYWVLVACMRDWVIMARYVESICVPIPGRPGRKSEDFVEKRYNLVFDKARDVYLGLTDDERLTDDIRRYRQRLLDLIACAPAEDVPNPVEFIQSAVKTAETILDMPEDAVESCIPYAGQRHVSSWLSARKLQAYGSFLPRDVAFGKVENIDDVVNHLEELRKQVGSQSPKSRMVDLAADFIEQINSDVDDTSKQLVTIPTPWEALNIRLGGGIPKGTGTLIAAAQGGGKTIASMQIGVNAAMLGYKVLIISTEEPAEAFQWRAGSAFCSIEWNKMKHRKQSMLSAENKNDLLKLFTPIKQNIMYEDWRDKDGGVAIESDLPPTLETFKEQRGSYPDLVIYDWIGAGLDEDKRMLGVKTALMERAGNYFCKYAGKYGYAAIATAQLNPSEGNARYKYSRGDLRDCKSLSAKFSTALYFSCVKKSSGVTKDGHNDIDPKQMINVDKTRGGLTGCIDIEANFAFQRFRTWGSRPRTPLEYTV